MKMTEDQKAQLDQELNDIFASPERTIRVVSELAVAIVALTPTARQHCPELLDVLAFQTLDVDSTTVLAATEQWQREANEAEEAAQLN